MQLYVGNSNQFIEDSVQNQIAEKLRISFLTYNRYSPPESEIRSWQNSLRAVSQVISHAGLTDQGVILEYQLPLTSKRLDCIFTGKDDGSRDNAVIIELKQWENCQPSFGKNEVVTYLGGSVRDVLHPSVQVGQYRLYLEDTQTVYHEENPVLLSACAYLHNYPRHEDDVLFHPKFDDAIMRAPLFTSGDVRALMGYLRGRLAKGYGVDVLKRIQDTEFRPSKKLMQHVGNTIRGKSEYILLDEQLEIYDKVFELVHTGFHQGKKTTLIVKGGPGTGKSVIAINLMADLLLKEYNAHYATGSKAFTETLRAVVGTRAVPQLKYFNSYGSAERDAIDVLICDEAHRIRLSSNNMYTPAAKRSDLPQVEEIINAARVSVFFIDDHQVVRPGEVGSVSYIKEHADRLDCQVVERELSAQFRCSGSDAFISWINNTLGIQRTAHPIWGGDPNFEFRIMNSPNELENAIKSKVAAGNSARLTAGFCWPWSDPKSDGTLVDDVAVGDLVRPWNAKPDATRLGKGIPKAPLWAYDPRGIGQIGCIYTAQGFEFDYVGVIIGLDLTYDLDLQKWQGHKERSYDTVVKRSGNRFADLVKNTYRVLFTRGMKGCYVYFMDKDTERFFRSRIEQ